MGSRRVPLASRRAGRHRTRSCGCSTALGVNYNNASSIDATARQVPRPSSSSRAESSSSTSTRGYYQDPGQLNTGENYTPGKRQHVLLRQQPGVAGRYSGEYGLKKDRDRKWFAGQFLWTGIDYIGEPTPYNVFPVKSSFFGAVDTAGFAKDFYHLFRSQWTTDPMVHLLPMNWTDHKPGDPVSGVGLQQRGHRRAVASTAGRWGRRSSTRRRPPTARGTWRPPRRAGTTRRGPPARSPAVTPVPTAARASCT